MENKTFQFKKLILKSEKIRTVQSNKMTEEKIAIIKSKGFTAEPVTRNTKKAPKKSEALYPRPESNRHVIADTGF